jgi:hypothetical protein
MSSTPSPRFDFDRQVSLSEAAARDANISSNDAFVLAMARAVQRGKEKVKVGTFVDSTPPIYSRRIRGEVSISACVSPAAMCTDTGARGDGGQTLR